MALDRTGEPIDEHRCWGGWATPPDSDAPRLCPICRPQPVSTGIEFEPTTYSPAARAAIERAEREDR